MLPTVSVFGLGYVGSVTAACLAHKGNRVLGVDVNPSKVKLLDCGRTPIVESGLERIIEESNSACRLHGTADARSAVLESEISFICVGTPSLRNGKLDLSSIKRVCDDIGMALREKREFHWVVLRSTVLPGTTQSVVVPRLEESSGKRAGVDFAICVNPEFLREGTAVQDFMNPSLTILGANDPSFLLKLRQLYQWVPGRLFETNLVTAEMVKYICNSFHALKVSFANEIGTLCKALGVDTEQAVEIFTSDGKLNISAAYLKPGFAFGGSCLPKDLRALTYRAKELDLRIPLLEAIIPSNSEHIDRTIETVLRTNKRKIGILGLSFKSGTDDLRESPLVQLVKRLLGEGVDIRIWDPNVALGHLIGSNRSFIEEQIPHIGALLCQSLSAVLEFAEVVLIGSGGFNSDMQDVVLRPEQIVIDLVNLDRSLRLNGGTIYEGICW